MRERPGPEEPEPRRPRPDIRLDIDDREQLLRIIAENFASESHANRLLSRIGYPSRLIPNRPDDGTPEDWWDLIFAQLEAGRVELGFTRLLEHAVREYRGNVRLFEIFERYLPNSQTPETAEAQGSPRCHVSVRAQNEQERAEAFETIRRLGLNPEEEFSTDYVVIYAVSSADSSFVRAQMDQTDLPWTVASPDAGHYLLHTLFVQGPDGSRLRLRDTPAAVTLETLASEVMATRYPGQDPQAVRETVVNRVHDNGEQERMNPQHTLEEAEVPDGAQVQIAFDSRAGGTPPSAAWEDAIARAANQISGFARQQRIRLTTNRPYLPTRYDLLFTKPSFGPRPPGSPDSPPTRIDRHKVRLLLLDGFPNHPPDVFWLTPFFHPNVFPNYDCEASRTKPLAKGLVCLGELATGWYPGMDLTEVCRVILDMAAYRNYDVFGVSSADLSQRPHVNFYDPEAAMWAVEHEKEITEMGGSALLPVLTIPPTVFRTSIEVIDQGRS